MHCEENQNNKKQDMNETKTSLLLLKFTKPYGVQKIVVKKLF